MINTKLIEKAMQNVGSFQLSMEWMSAGQVAAAIETDKGNIYTGICIDVSCGIGFCAEHAAIAEMLKNRETRIVQMVAVHGSNKIIPPCGRCRELIMQINSNNKDCIVLLEGDRYKTISDLLPESWL